MILPCSCKHEYQDRQYGQGRRYMNLTAKSAGGTKRIYRCTVCGAEQER